MQAAQAAAEHYLEEIQIRADHEFQRIIREANEEAAAIIEKAHQEAAGINLESNNANVDYDPLVEAILKEWQQPV